MAHMTTAKDNADADRHARALYPGDLLEQMAAFLFNCDYRSEWGDLADFWYRESGEVYRDRARRVIAMAREAAPEALEALQ